MQIVQHTDHAKQVNDMHLSTVLREAFILFRDNRVIHIFNSAKTKVMVILTPQMSKHHQLEEKINVKCNSITLERVLESKLLGVTLDEHFHLDKRILKLLKDSYSPLSLLKKLQRYTTLPVQK